MQHIHTALGYSVLVPWALAQRALQVLLGGLVPVLVPVLVPGQALIARKRMSTYKYQSCGLKKRQNRGLSKQMRLS